MKKNTFSLTLLLSLCFLISLRSVKGESSPKSANGPVIIADMDMMILPGTLNYLKDALAYAEEKNAALLVIRLNTPGGMLSTTQSMTQEIFKASIPVAIVVSPSGGTASSAGVFLTLAGHIAAMEPGTSIGAAHPVAAGGEDISGDMRKKVENMATAMVKAISEQRGRNVSWAEQSVRDSSSITEREALKRGVVDMVVEDVSDLLVQSKGRSVVVGRSSHIIPDLTDAQRIFFQISTKNYIVNLIANPTVAALLWMAAAIGIWIEVQNPGLILPGVAGVICLVLALAVTQVIPLTTGGIVMILLGGMLLGLELYFPSGILGFGGVLALSLGVSYLVDVDLAPELQVDYLALAPFAFLLIAGFVFLAVKVREVMVKKPITGFDLLIGREARCLTELTPTGKIHVAGEIWKALSTSGTISKGAKVVVTGIHEGLVAVVRTPPTD
jgi:membrane-bound serine protease (ClpP class)